MHAKKQVMLMFSFLITLVGVVSVHAAISSSALAEGYHYPILYTSIISPADITNNLISITSPSLMINTGGTSWTFDATSGDLDFLSTGNGNVHITKGFVVDGISTLQGVSATSLDVSGASTLQGVSATSLDVSGASTLQGVSASSLDVSGASALNSVSASSITTTGAVNANSVSADSLIISGAISAGSISASSITATTITADTICLTGDDCRTTWPTAPTPPTDPCGNGVIDSGERCDNGTGVNTNTACSPNYGETCTYCNTSCVDITIVADYCGDGVCNSAEDSLSCPGDCPSDPPPSPVCGDNLCSGNESCATCIEDCGTCGTGGGGGGSLLMMKVCEGCDPVGGGGGGFDWVRFCWINPDSCSYG